MMTLPNSLAFLSVAQLAHARAGYVVQPRQPAMCMAVGVVSLEDRQTTWSLGCTGTGYGMPATRWRGLEMTFVMFMFDCARAGLEDDQRKLSVADAPLSPACAMYSRCKWRSSPSSACDFSRTIG